MQYLSQLRERYFGEWQRPAPTRGPASPSFTMRNSPSAYADCIGRRRKLLAPTLDAAADDCCGGGVRWSDGGMANGPAFGGSGVSSFANFAANSFSHSVSWISFSQKIRSSG